MTKYKGLKECIVDGERWYEDGYGLIPASYIERDRSKPLKLTKEQIETSKWLQKVLEEQMEKK